MLGFTKASVATTHTPHFFWSFQLDVSVRVNVALPRTKLPLEAVSVIFTAEPTEVDDPQSMNDEVPRFRPALGSVQTRTEAPLDERTMLSKTTLVKETWPLDVSVIRLEERDSVPENRKSDKVIVLELLYPHPLAAVMTVLLAVAVPLPLPVAVKAPVKVREEVCVS